MMCNHSISDQDIAVIADGMCPLCQAIEIERLRAENKRLRAALKGDPHNESSAHQRG
jgi:hypothetical protein